MKVDQKYLRNFLRIWFFKRYLRKMRIIDGYYYFEIQSLTNRNTIVLNAPVIFSGEKKQVLAKKSFA